jgi:tetratricopeptide (TPR) repeat protein
MKLSLSVLPIIVLITLTIFGCKEKPIPEAPPEMPLSAIPPETGEETETVSEVQEEAAVPDTPVKPMISMQPSRSLRDLSLSLPKFGINIGELNPVNYQKADPAVLRQMGMEPYLISFIVAERLYREGSYRDAIAEYSRSISLKPDYADVLEGRGNAWLKSGDTGRAIDDYTRAINLRANGSSASRAELFNSRGYVYAERGETEKAIADFTQALILKPSYADALANRSRAYYRTGDYAKVIDDCTRLIALEPENCTAWNRRGSAWYAMRDDDRAIADFTRALAIKPDFALALHNRGNAWHSKGELTKALADLDSAIAIDPGYVAARASREYITNN